MSPVMLDGREPLDDAEIALAPRTMDDLGVSVGDAVAAFEVTSVDQARDAVFLRFLHLVDDQIDVFAVVLGGLRRARTAAEPERAAELDVLMKQDHAELCGRVILQHRADDGAPGEHHVGSRQRLAENVAELA